MSGLLLLAPMGLEARALRRGAPEAHVHVTGIGPRRARRAAARMAGAQATGVAVAGFGGGLDSELEPGDVVVASELRTRDGSLMTRCEGAGIIAGMLRRQGLRVHVGPVVSVRGPATGAERGILRRNANALLADMESAWLGPTAHGRPFVTARVVVDTPGSELWNPLAMAAGFARAARSLSAVGGVLAEWASVIAPRELVIAAPRASCAGYATQNRQDAVRALASSCDLVLVVGSRNSSNSSRLVEVAKRHGCEARLVDDEAEIEPGWLAGKRRVGVTAGASTPESIVQRLVGALAVVGPLDVREQPVTDEKIRFALPR